MAKRLLLVHGRARKPREEVKRKLALRALKNGLSRAGVTLDEGMFDLAYYGDINNLVLDACERGDAVTAALLQSSPGDVRYELEVGRYERAITKLEALTDAQQDDPEFYAKLRREVRDLGALDDLASIASPIARALGLGDKLLNAFLPDLAAYFGYRTYGSALRKRLTSKLLPALERGDDVCVVAHSMGSVVAYDVLWKLSRMSEYSDYHDRRISLLVTIGSPLGEPAIRSQLYDAHEPKDGVYPTNIDRWMNFAAHDDFVCHDEDLRDDFDEMVKRGYLASIGGGLQDYRIFNHYVDEQAGLNPHKLYGYLCNKHVGQAIAGWLRA